MLKGWIVYDGDNVHRCADAETSPYPNLSLGELDRAIRRPDWPSYVNDFVKREDVRFTSSIGFVTDRTLLNPDPGYQYTRHDSAFDLELRVYSLTGGRGYNDKQIFYHLRRYRAQYDFIVMVTSDRDFVSYMSLLADDFDKTVMIVSFQHILGRRSPSGKLDPARMFWVHDFLPPDSRSSQQPPTDQENA